MASDPRKVNCRDCGRELIEDPSAERKPCPECQSLAREHRLGGRIELVRVRALGDVTVQAPAASASAAAGYATASIEKAIDTGTFTRTVVWSKTPEAWLAEVRDASGSLVGLEINFDAMDTLVLLAEHLLPPGE
jgi:hypothetical protein